MKSSHVVVTLALLLCGIGVPASPEPQQKPSLPVVVVDAAHSRDTPSFATYVVPPGEGLVLDVTKYRFPPLDRPEVPPNVVELDFTSGPPGLYRTAWQESRRIELTARTLKPGEESGPYPGLKPGDKVVVTIGLMTPIPNTDNTSFNVYWTAFIKVAP
jgi:hypothetical protein